MKMSIPATITLLFLSVNYFAASSQAPAGNGAAIFHARCVGCHGSDGRAQTEMGKKAGAADLTSDAVQKQEDSELVAVVKKGKGNMPALGDKLSDDEVHAVITYVRHFGKQR